MKRMKIKVRMMIFIDYRYVFRLCVIRVIGGRCFGLWFSKGHYISFFMFVYVKGFRLLCYVFLWSYSLFFG